MDQPILPGHLVASIDQDGEGTRGQVGLIKDGVKGMPWGQRSDVAARFGRYGDDCSPECLNFRHGVL